MSVEYKQPDATQFENIKEFVEACGECVRILHQYEVNFYLRMLEFKFHEIMGIFNMQLMNDLKKLPVSAIKEEKTVN